jgi:hypothetical protein
VGIFAESGQAATEPSGANAAGRRNPRAVTGPIAPMTLDQTGLEQQLLLSLLVKLMYLERLETERQFADAIKLPVAVVGELVELARKNLLIHTLGTEGASVHAEMRYELGDKGRHWAQEALTRSAYAGPAPVSLQAFHNQVERQRIGQEILDRRALEDALGDLVLPPSLLSRLGPAANSGRSILLYGDPGNGKTCIAEAMARAFTQTIFIPHALEIGGQIINLYDPNFHEAVSPFDSDFSLRRNTSAGVDPRWVECRRPVVMTGGELTLEMLDLRFSEASRIYEAPAQLKATGGIFIIDDFGRQRCPPQDLINRWIIPMERGNDFLSLATGRKFTAPFDSLVIFSTNVHPDDLVDAAALRRINYKIRVERPTRADFIKIFTQACQRREVAFDEDVLLYLIQSRYEALGKHYAGFHPKFLVDHVVAQCDFEGIERRLSRRSIDAAWENLFTRT